MGRRLPEEDGGGVTAGTAMLPKEFADLEPFADWCLPSERSARQAVRQLDGRDAGVLRRHHASRRRGDRVLDQYPLDDLPEALNLMHLLYSMIMVSFPVECWHQPRIPDSGAAALEPVGTRTVSETTVLRADRWADIDEGEVRSPAVIVVEGNRIVGGEPHRGPDDRPRSTSATSRSCPA